MNKRILARIYKNCKAQCGQCRIQKESMWRDIKWRIILICEESIPARNWTRGLLHPRAGGLPVAEKSAGRDPPAPRRGGKPGRATIGVPGALTAPSWVSKPRPAPTFKSINACVRWRTTGLKLRALGQRAMLFQYILQQSTKTGRAFTVRGTGYQGPALSAVWSPDPKVKWSVQDSLSSPVKWGWWETRDRLRNLVRPWVCKTPGRQCVFTNVSCGRPHMIHPAPSGHACLAS